jgi:autotransporter-associated beta strand protein
VTIPNVISGTGTVNQTGTGSTTLGSANTYTGITSVNAGILRASNLTNEGGAGGTPSSIGASSNAASNLILTGGTLQYTGAGASTDRLFSVTASGGTLDASGSGALVFNNGGTVLASDPGPRATTLSNTSAKLTLPSVADLVVGMTVTGTGTRIPPGTTIISITQSANSVTLSSTPTFVGADTVSFGTASRTLVLTGTNAGANMMSNSLANSAGGGTLGVTKSGTGAWSLTKANSYTGVTTVQGGTLTAVGSAAWGPALANSNITGGRLVFDYTSDSSPAVPVLAALDASYDTGFATGALRSTAANSSKGLGWKDDGPSSKKVTVMYTYFGDANLDGQVNTDDFNALATNFNGAGTWVSGDFNYDGIVNALDFNAVATNFGSPVLTAAAPLGTPVLGTPALGTPALGTPVLGTPVLGTPVLGTPVLGTLVTEPASIVLLGMIGVFGSRRRRQA